MKTLDLSHLKSIKGDIILPTSKSISNRLLIINALSGGKIKIINLSSARDTQIMQDLLNSFGLEKNTQDAGTVMRFLTAYYAIGKKEVILTGSEQMKKRPIGVLVDALNLMGANITYLGEFGYPPLKILPFEAINACQELEINSTISSQYISAILMIAPYLPNGLWLKLQGNIASEPYIKMTLGLMANCGAEYEWVGNKIHIKNIKYANSNLEIESDWSAASYWYSFLFICGEGELFLNGLKNESLQGDQIVSQLFEKLGVKTTYEDSGIRLTIENKIVPKHIHIDFTDSPDLAQTMVVACAVKGIQLTMSGVESLKIKETNRILALRNELSKIGVDLSEEGNNYIVKGKTIDKLPNDLMVNTYKDHRMAMAFAPLSLLGAISFDEEEVVDKSFPGFWKEVEKLF